MRRCWRIFITLGVFCLTACNLQIPEFFPESEKSDPWKTQESIPSPDFETPLVTATPETTPSLTPIPTQPQETPTITPTPKPTASPYALGVQLGSPKMLPYFAHPEVGCQWMGVAGQIFDRDGMPLIDLVVEIGGTIGDQVISGLAVTGSSSSYGPGSFEIKLGDTPRASSDTLWVRVLDLDGLPLSAPVYLQTMDNCEQNLTLLNFVESNTLPDNWIYLPLMVQDP